MKKTVIILLLTIVMLFTFTPVSIAYQPTNFDVSAEAAMLVSLDSGAVLYTKNPDELMYPASLTKLMTAVLILEDTEDYDSEVITVTKQAIDLLAGTGSSIAGLKDGEQITARQMLYNLLMASANDGANAVAEHYGGGNPDNFIAMMNEKAEELGMTNTHYVNPHGLHDEQHYTTVSDMYKLVKYAVSLPLFMEVVSTSRYNMPATNKSPAKTLVTTNYLQDSSTEYYYRYAKGIKTGFTDPAGRCLITTAKKNGYNYLCILMKSPINDQNGNRVRKEFGDSKNLYEWAFNNFEYRSVIDPTVPLGEVELDLAWNRDHASLIAEKEFSTLIPEEADTSTIKTELLLDADKIDAPIEKGTVLGKAKIIYAGEEIGEVNVVAAETIEMSKALLFLRYARKTVNSFWFRIVIAVVFLLIIIFIIATIILNRRRKSIKRVRSYRRL